MDVYKARNIRKVFVHAAEFSSQKPQTVTDTKCDHRKMFFTHQSLGDVCRKSHDRDSTSVKFSCQELRQWHRWLQHSLALVSALAHFIVEVHLDLQDELQLLVGHECGQ